MDLFGPIRTLRRDFWHGDCLTLMRNIRSGSVDLCVTSPPYDNLRTYGGSLDSWSETKWKPVILELYRIIREGGIVVWNVADATVDGSETGSSFRQALYAMECGFKLHDTMIYHKSSQPKQNGVRYEQHFEYMFVFVKGKWRKTELLREPSKQAGRTTFRTSRDCGKEDLIRTEINVSDTKVRGNVWFYGSKENPTGHPAVFPKQLVTDHILSWTNPGDTVIDPFAGSGTTAIAAMNTGRGFICIEKDDEYYRRATERVARHA